MLSPDLRARLYGDAELEEISHCLALREEARAVIPVLLAAARQPAGEVGVREVVGARFVTYPQPERSDAEWHAWWADYYDALEDVPWGVLEEAMKAYIRQPDAEFMPKPGRLLELCRNMATPDFRAAQRAKSAVELWDRGDHDRRPKALPVDVDAPKVKTFEEMEAQRATIQRMARETLAALKATAEVRQTGPKELPSIAGKPDESGITPEMRAVLARQRGEA